jgi:hypothetical protein
VRSTKCFRSSVAFSSRPKRMPHPAASPSAGCAKVSRDTSARSAAERISGTADCGPDSRSRRARGIGTASGSGPMSGMRSSASGERTPARYGSAAVLPVRGRAQDHELEAAVDREQRVAVLDRHAGVHRRAVEHVPPQRRAAVIGRESRRQHNPEPGLPGAPARASARRRAGRGWRGRPPGGGRRPSPARSVSAATRRVPPPGGRRRCRHRRAASPTAGCR